MQLDNPLWRYALRVYSQPLVEPACLAAQATGLHVNTLLLCCWLATKGEVYRPERYSGVFSVWRDPVLVPLRRLRYEVRELCQQHSGMQACYTQLKQAELAAEQVEVALLWQLHREPVFPITTAESAGILPNQLAQQNISAYLKAVDMSSLAYVECCNQLVDVVLRC